MADDAIRQLAGDSLPPAGDDRCSASNSRALCGTPREVTDAVHSNVDDDYTHTIEARTVL
ncbi:MULTISPECIES: hypothetical protein [Haloarcula]|uniref:hypothetical protein n=1 Tax=Haloarcula TaxID=2237 RepID=UPI0023E84D1C|nr:hypothetical protein [Halomicroarcula sp. SHR3]